MKLRTVPPKFAVLLPCLGVAVFGTLTVMADPPERTGSDAPHHERNLAQNEQKTALPLTDLNVPEFAGKPVRKATAVKTTSASRKSKDRKKAAQQARDKQKTEAATAETAQERQRYDPQVDDFVGSDAPHQERGSDPNKRAARLFILER